MLFCIANKPKQIKANDEIITEFDKNSDILSDITYQNVNQILSQIKDTNVLII